MNILGQEINRDQLPTLTMRQMNPDHLYQSMQDRLANKLGLGMPIQQPGNDMSQAMESTQNG